MVQGKIPSSIGQQVFVIASGIAGGLAGFVLANRLTNVRRVSTSATILAASVSAVATFASLYIITSQIRPEDEI